MLLLVETVFDTLNAKAADRRVHSKQAFEATGVDAAAHHLGHDHRSLGPHALGPDTLGLLELAAPRQRPFAIGLNCALGAQAKCVPMSPRLARVADTLICAYPNAGLPNEFGLYDESPEYMSELHGGICPRPVSSTSSAAAAASTPAHISRLRRSRPQGQAAARKVPKIAPIPEASRASSLSTLSERTSASSTLANAPTSRAPRNSASSSRKIATPRRSMSPATRCRTARRSSTSTWTKACSTPKRRW